MAKQPPFAATEAYLEVSVQQVWALRTEGLPRAPFIRFICKLCGEPVIPITHPYGDHFRHEKSSRCMGTVRA